MRPREASDRPARAQAGQHRARSLPAPLTRLIGRASELAAVCRALLEPHIRLLTLVGPPGVGKTRLALEAAAGLLAEFAHGVVFVPLAALRDPELVASAVAQPLGVQEFGAQPLAETLQAAIGDRDLLLLLDNFEHLLAAAPLIAGLLAACPALKVLATSRAPLHVYGEHEFPVPPLALPDLQQPVDPEALAEVPAVALLLERARAVRPDFALTARNAAAAAELCARLDGLPLAIELAAAHLKLLPPEAILARLGSRLDPLTDAATGRPERHWALRAAIAWSYDLLSADEQRLLRRLAVFRGGCTLGAAEAVCGPSPVLEGLASLVDRSLVRQTEQAGDEPRFWMLETIREYAREPLEASGEAEATRRRHAEYFAALAERTETEFSGREQAAWVARLGLELDNLRAALAWSLTAGGGVELGLRLAGALWGFWDARGLLAEGRVWLTELLSRGPGRTAARARALHAASFLAFNQGDFDAMQVLSEELLGLARELGDRAAAARALITLALASLMGRRGDPAHAVARLEESAALAREAGDLFHLGVALFWLAEIARQQGDYRRATELLEENRAISEGSGNVWGLAYVLASLGHVALLRGEHDRAAALFKENLAVRRELNDRRSTALALEQLAWAASAQGAAQRATRLLSAAEALNEATGARFVPQYHADHDRAEAAASAALGEHAFAAAWDEGRAMPLEEAVEYGLSEEEPSPGSEQAWAAPTAEGAPLLTAREREIAILIARGLSNRQIAEQLVLSVRTVERHIENLYTKLGVSGRVARAAVAAFALRHGLA